MNQRNAAMGLASLGRGSDSSLVHMSPREIQALQQLAVQHGGSLTINPETGLPEAGFLNSLLPMIAGIGLSFVPGVGPLGAGLMMGAGALAASGGDLGKAAKWGLGGYGGASLGAGLTAAGTATAPAVAPSAAASTNPATVIAPDLVMKSPIPTYAAQSPIPTYAAQNPINAKFATVPSSSRMSAFVPDVVTKAAPAAPAGSMFQQFGANAETAMRGVPELFNPAGRKAFTAGIADASPSGLGAKTAAFAGLGSLALQEPEALAEVDVPGTEEVAYPAYAPLNRQASAPRNLPLAVNNPYGLEDSSEQDFFSEPNYRAYDPNIDPYNAFYQPGVATAAQGGIVSLQEGGVVDRGEQDYFTASRPTIDYTKVSPSRAVPNQYVTEANKYLLDYNQTGGKSGYYTPKFFTNNPTFGGGSTIPLRTFAQPTGPSADSGERSYFNYAAGGLTAGPGDGMSDDIMTTIAGRQRAALSPGEFVVPADVVSGIGNGDTNSGAKRLYAMMDDIRDGRTGQTAQPQRINPRLPA